MSVLTPRSMSRKLSVAIFCSHFGPYHYARITALNEKCVVTAIQLADSDRDSGWTAQSSNHQTPDMTLTQNDSEGAGHLRAALLLWQALNRVRPTAVLVPGHGTLASFAAGAWCKLYRSRSVLLSTSTSFDQPRVQWKELLKGFLIRTFFDCVVSAGRRSRDYLCSLGFPAHRMVIGGNAVDNDFFAHGVGKIREQSKPTAYGLSNRYLLYVGRLASEKNLIFLLRAFNSYRLRGGKCDLILIGGGPLALDLKREAGELECGSHVAFVGRLSPSDLLPFYAFAEALVLPSLSETWGLVVNEAMASGVPAIVSERCGCVGDLVTDGVNGFVFDPHDEEALISLFSLMEARDARTRQQQSYNARAAAAKYTPVEWAAKVEDLIRTTCDHLS